MKKNFKYLAFFILIGFRGSSSEVLPKALIRLTYISAATNEQDCMKLLNYCEINEISDIHFRQAYKACGMIIMAKHLINPISKMTHFNKGKDLLEEVIRKAPLNTELRYLRFSVQSNVPGFLNYNKELQTDKVFLLNSLRTLEDDQLKKLILNVLNKSELPKLN